MFQMPGMPGMAMMPNMMGMQQMMGQGQMPQMQMLSQMPGMQVASFAGMPPGTAISTSLNYSGMPNMPGMPQGQSNQNQYGEGVMPYIIMQGNQIAGVPGSAQKSSSSNRKESEKERNDKKEAKTTQGPQQIQMPGMDFNGGIFQMGSNMMPNFMQLNPQGQMMQAYMGNPMFPQQSGGQQSSGTVMQGSQAGMVGIPFGNVPQNMGNQMPFMMGGQGQMFQMGPGFSGSPVMIGALQKPT